MDAASKFKSLVIALSFGLGIPSLALGDDGENSTKNSVQCDGKCCQDSAEVCCNPSDCLPSSTGSGLAAWVSDWLAMSPKFSVGLEIHFGSTTEQPNKLGANAPSVNVTDLTASSAGNGILGHDPQVTMPMTFTQCIPRMKLGDFVGGVIACGHRICAGNKCYDVQDEPVAGTHCDVSGVHVVVDSESDEEPILVAPVAPPAPPGLDIAYSYPAQENYSDETEAASILRNSGLQQVKVSLPVTTIVDLLVAKTELSTRLEMTEHIMTERFAANEQLMAMAERNARLSTQLAVAEARQHASEVMTAGLVEKVELAVRLAALEAKTGLETKTGKVQDSSLTSQTIQEDLSNIRRQIALLRRSQPVPFAPSYVGVTQSVPYVPTAQLPGYVPSGTESATLRNETECGEEKAVK